MRGYGFLALIFVVCVGIFLAAWHWTNPEASLVWNDTSVTALVRNVSWDTEYVESVPFQKGDELQYYYIIRSDRTSRVRFDLSEIKNVFEVRSVSVDGKPVGSDGIADLSEASGVRIDVVAKSQSNESPFDPKDWLTYSVISSGDTTDSIVSENPPETPAQASSGISLSGSADIPAHPQVGLLENDHPIGTSMPLDPRTDHLLKLSGETALRVSSIVVGDRRVPVRRVDNESFIALSAREFAAGDYFVALEYDSQFLRPTDLSLRFADYPDRSVEVHAITPDTLDNEHAVNLVLQGRGFDRVVSIQLNNTYILKSTEFTRINDRVMVVEIPEGLDPGTYFLNIMLPNEIVWVPESTFRVLAK